MNLEFEEQMAKLSKYFGVPITEHQLNAYYDNLRYIPVEIFCDICTKIINDRKPFKSNFPTITQFGPLYESGRPKKEHTEFEPEPCEECKGEGLIYFKYWHFKHGIAYTSHVACACCNNWKRHYNTLGSYPVYGGDGKFLYRHPGIERSTKEQLCLKRGVIEVPENGVFIMTRKQISDKVLEFYGESASQ